MESMSAYLFHRKNSNVGIRLATALGWNHGSQGNTIPDGGLVVRWGNRLPFPGEIPSAEYNKPEAIAVAADKLAAINTMRAAGVETLPLLDTRNPALPCLGRTRVHERGSGFFPCQTREQVQDALAQGAEYFVPLLAGFREYRVHVFLDTVLRTVFKRSATDWERTTAQGTAEGIARRAVHCLGLDMGAVDLIKHNELWYVLEVNTAPDVDAGDLKVWVAALRSLQEYHTAKSVVDRFTSVHETIH